jgi:5-methylcytosine-specific restriction endonuclease McrA
MASMGYITKICARCGKPFRIPGYWPYRKYCSKECAQTAPAERVALTCVICGRTYYVVPSRVGLSKCCSVECVHEYCRRLRGPVTVKRRLRYRQWQRVRKQVLERDGYRCQQCGSVKGLVVHHIRPWVETQDDSLGNLITVCRACHARLEFAVKKKGITVPDIPSLA